MGGSYEDTLLGDNAILRIQGLLDLVFLGYHVVFLQQDNSSVFVMRAVAGEKKRSQVIGRKVNQVGLAPKVLKLRHHFKTCVSSLGHSFQQRPEFYLEQSLYQPRLYQIAHLQSFS